MRIPIVHSMTSPKTGYPVANQFEIVTHDGRYFQSYRSVIAFVDRKTGQISLNDGYFDYSRTTMKYLNQFLGHNMAETRKKIASGEYLVKEFKYSN